MQGPRSPRGVCCAGSIEAGETDECLRQIEAKMGRIVEKHSGERIQLPVKTETAVVMQPDWRFESTMSEVRVSAA